MAVKPSKPAPASTSGAAGVPALVPQGAHEGKPAMPLGRPVTVIGSRNRAHLHLLSRTVSKSHALVVNTGTGVYIRDLASRTHVLVNNKLIKEAELRHGDIIQVGSFLFKFSNPAGKNWKKPGTPAPPAALDIADDDQPAMPIEGRVMLIGRRPTSDIPLLEPAVSTSHAVIFEINGQRYVRDLGSRTGTFLNGENVHQAVLKPGDLIRVGDTEMRYALESAEAERPGEEEPSDELDHLMRTAPLAPEEAAGTARPPRAPVPPAAATAAAPIPLAEDRIPIELEPEEPAAPVQRAAAAPAPVEKDESDLADFGLLPEGEPTEEHPAAELDLIPIEPGDRAAVPPQAPAPLAVGSEDDQLDEIDIFGESEVTAPLAAPPVQPLAPQPLPPPADTVNIHEDEQQLLVDTNLRAERLSSSGSFTPVPVELDEEEPEPADVTVHPEDALDVVEADHAPPVAVDAIPLEPMPEALPPPPLPPPPSEVRADVAPELAPPEPMPSEPLAPALETEELADFAPPPPPPEMEVPEPAGEVAAPPHALTEGPPAAVEAPEAAAGDEPEEDWLDLAIEQMEAPGAAAAAAEPETTAWAPPVPLSAAAAAEAPAEAPPEVLPPEPPAPAPTVDEDLPLDAAAAPAPLPVEQAMEDLDFALEAPVAAEPAAPEPDLAPPPGAELPEPPPIEIPSGLSDVAPALPPLDVIEPPSPPAAVEPTPLPEPAPIEAPPADLAVVEPLAAAPAAPAETLQDVALGRAPAEDEATAELDLAGLVVDESDVAVAPVERAADEPSAGEPSPPAFPTPVADETDIATASVVPEPAGATLGDDVAQAPADIAAAALDDEPAEISPAAPPVEAEPAAGPVPPVAGPVMATEADLDAVPDLDAGLDASSYTDLRASRILKPDEAGLAAPLPPPPVEVSEPEADAGLDASSYTDLRASRILGPAETGAAAPAPAPPPDLLAPAEAELDADDLDDLLADEPPPLAPPAPAPQPPQAEAAAPPAPPPAATRAAPASPPDLMRGMTRDIGSFIGGMPLSLPPAPPPPAKPPRRDPREAALDEFVLDEAGANLQEFEGHQPPRAAPPPRPPPPRGSAPTPPPPARAAGPRGGFGQEEVDAPAGAGWDAAAPFAGAPGRVSTAFDGLAMPPVAEADVFWQMPLAGGTAAAAATPDVPLGTGPGAAVDVPRSPRRPQPERDRGETPPPGADAADEFAVDDGDGEPAAEGMPFEYRDEALAANLAAAGAAAQRAGAALGVDRRPPSVTPPAAGAPRPQPGAATAVSPRRGLGNRVLLFIILVALAAIAAVWLYPKFVPKANVSGSLPFDRLERYQPDQRLAFARDQANRLRDPQTQALAAELLRKTNPTLAAGFLAPAGNPADTITYERLADSAAPDEKGSALVLTYDGADAGGDGARLRALLQALYEANQPLAEKAQKSAADYESKRQELAQLAAEIEATEREARAVRERVDVDPAIQREALRRVQDEAERLGRRYGDAIAAVGNLQAELQLLEATLPSPGDDAAAARGANGAGSAPAFPSDEDPQLLEMTQKVQDLSASLAQRKKARDGRAEEARKALDAALIQFDKEIKAAAQKNKGESQLGRYLASAQRIQNTIRKLNDELTARNMAMYDRLNSLKGNLAQENNNRVRKAWANDPDLKNLERELAMKERRRNAAAGTPALKVEAARLQDDIDRINTEIEARRDLLVTADGQAGYIKAIEQLLDETLKQMQTSQQKDDQMMRDLLAELSHEAPQLEGLPAEQKAQAEQLERRSEDLNKARAAYTAAMTAAAAQADEQIGQGERELAQLQARLDARRNQLVQAASGVLSPEQVRARRLSAEQKRQELAAAKQAEAEARAAYVASQQKLLAAESEAKAVVAQRDNYQNNVNRLSELRGRQQKAKAELDGLEKAAANAIIPKPPGDDAVTVVREPDRLRWGLTFVLGTVAVALGCFMLFANMRAGSQVSLAARPPLEAHGEADAGGAAIHTDEPVAV